MDCRNVKQEADILKWTFVSFLIGQLQRTLISRWRQRGSQLTCEKVMALPEGHVLFLLPLLTFPIWLANHQYAQARDLSLSVTSLGVTGSWPVGWCTLLIPVPSLVGWNNAETLQSGRVYPSGVGIIQVKGGWRFEKFSFLFMLKNPHNILKRRFALNSKNKDCPIFFNSAWAHCFGDDLALRHTW
jgi:hypothetical protein